MNRNIGYYWVFGNKCFLDNQKWVIAFWDGHYFWCDGDDFDESTFYQIDENQIVKT